MNDSAQALLIIDVQNEYFTGKLPVSYPPGSLANITKAQAFANARGIPVIVIQHGSAAPDAKTFIPGSDAWQLHPEIAQSKYSVVFHKTLPNSFHGTALDSWLKEHRIKSIVISGYMTQMCCDTTARAAFHRGYKVVFLADATGTLTLKNAAGEVTAENLHKTILIVQQSRFSTVINTENWIKDAEKLNGQIL